MPSAWYKEGTVRGSSRKIKVKRITQVLALRNLLDTLLTYIMKSK